MQFMNLNAGSTYISDIVAPVGVTPSVDTVLTVFTYSHFYQAHFISPKISETTKISETVSMLKINCT